MKEVESLRKRTDASEVKAVIFEALEMLNDPPETNLHNLLLKRGNGEAIQFADDESGRWLEKLSRMVIQLEFEFPEF